MAGDSDEAALMMYAPDRSSVAAQSNKVHRGEGYGCRLTLALPYPLWRWGICAVNSASCAATSVGRNPYALRGVKILVNPMRTQPSLLIMCAVLGTACSQSPSLPKDVSWDKTTSTFAWWGGKVRVPSGFTYQVDQGADTFEGHFTAPDGKLVIRHDIGWYAGAWASAKDATSFEERLIEGARVWTARKNWPAGRGGTTTLVAVTFPDAGCANFFLYSSRIEDAEVVNYVAHSYRPNSRQDAGMSSPCQNVFVFRK